MIFNMEGASLVGVDAPNYILVSVDDAYGIIQKPLPVTLISFEGKQRSGSSVGLTWRTATEKDNDYFQVERSQDGRAFAAIGQVKGNGTTNVVQAYSYTDGTALAGTVYYRLKQVDYDGKFEYSKVIAVKASGAASLHTSIVAKPNPTSGKLVLIASHHKGAGNVALLHSSGKVMLAKEVQIEPGQPIEIDLSGWSPGVYYLQLKTATGMAVTKIVKQ